MATDDDMPNLQGFDRELQHGHQIEIADRGQVGDVAMDEQFAGLHAHHLIGGHSAV